MKSQSEIQMSSYIDDAGEYEAAGEYEQLQCLRETGDNVCRACRLRAVSINGQCDGQHKAPKSVPGPRAVQNPVRNSSLACIFRRGSVYQPPATDVARRSSSPGSAAWLTSRVRIRYIEYSRHSAPFDVPETWR